MWSERIEYLKTDQSIRINNIKGICIIYGPYTAAKSLNGSIKIAPIILNTTPSVNPTIANGSNISQKNIRIKNKPTARGQHRTNSMQKSNTAINSFIATKVFYLFKIKYQTRISNKLIIS